MDEYSWGLTMNFLNRAYFGWPSSAASSQTSTLGTKIHYEGTPVHIASDHNLCIQEWKNIRESHLANTKEGYVDIAYNFGACPHGWLFEGRGLGKETAANGNQDLNHAHYSIVGLVGDSGDVTPTDLMLGSIRDGIELLQANGAGPEIKGHRDGYPTDCPGDALYNWVKQGAPRPGGTPKPSPAPSPVPTPNHPWPGVYVKQGSTGDIVRTIQARLSARGWTIGVDGQFGPQTDRVIRQFQAEKNLGVDGIVGPATWSALWNAPIT